MKIAVDFDGTIVYNFFPAMGNPVPGAFETLRELEDLGHQLILNTVRSGQYLDEAVDFCGENGVEFWGINKNPEQQDYSMSPKVHAKWYIDDKAIGCPLLRSYPEADPYVDWDAVRQLLRDRGVPLI